MKIFYVHLLFIILDQITFIQTNDPLIETLSFGIDIQIKCNESYFHYDEHNKNVSTIWRFAHPSSYCQEKQQIESVVNECGVYRIDENHLKVQLMKTLISKPSKYYHEYASVYCPINYKPIAPLINVRRIDDKSDSFYQFNLTATGLDRNQSFEIIWVKRVHSIHSISVNYWFSPECITHGINILKNNNQSIVFTISDSRVRRVEFLIRRCYETCRRYEQCPEDYEPSMDEYHGRESLEKISCDHDCLGGMNMSSSSSLRTRMNDLSSSSTRELPREKQLLKSYLLYSLPVFLFVFVLIIIGCLILSRIKALRTDNVYSKTMTVNIDENKETIEQ